MRPGGRLAPISLTDTAGRGWQQDRGEVVAQAPASELHAIPWLLLRVRAHDGNGILSAVDPYGASTRKAGRGSDHDCDAVGSGDPGVMRYTARYLFYEARR